MSEAQIGEMYRRGEIPHVRIGWLVRIPVAELVAWVSSRTEGNRDSNPD